MMVNVHEQVMLLLVEEMEKQHEVEMEYEVDMELMLVAVQLE